jgi:uncharacterized FlaG/YvyC family protein
VINPVIKVEDKGEYLEVYNNSSSEINLFNWKVEDAGKGFIFQPNTIILPHASIKIDKILLTMKGLDNSAGLVLKNSLKDEVFNIKNEVLIVQEKTKDISPQVSFKYKEQVATVVLNQTASSTDNIIYEVPKQTGFISRLTNFVKRVFFK